MYIHLIFLNSFLFIHFRKLFITVYLTQIERKCTSLMKIQLLQCNHGKIHCNYSFCLKIFTFSGIQHVRAHLWSRFVTMAVWLWLAIGLSRMENRLVTNTLRDNIVWMTTSSLHFRVITPTFNGSKILSNAKKRKWRDMERISRRSHFTRFLLRCSITAAQRWIQFGIYLWSLVYFTCVLYSDISWSLV